MNREAQPPAAPAPDPPPASEGDLPAGRWVKGDSGWQILVDFAPGRAPGGPGAGLGAEIPVQLQRKGAEAETAVVRLTSRIFRHPHAIGDTPRLRAFAELAEPEAPPRPAAVLHQPRTHPEVRALVRNRKVWGALACFEHPVRIRHEDIHTLVDAAEPFGLLEGHDGDLEVVRAADHGPLRPYR